MNMENFNNHSLDAINSRVCMASPSDENNDEGTKIHHIRYRQVNHRDYTKEYLDYLSYLKKVYNIEELTEDEEKTLLFLLNKYSEETILKATEYIPAKVIKHFCKAVDNNKKLPELYRADKSEAIEKLCIRFEKETKMPQNSNAENISMEYLGYYNSKACQIILFPERIKNAPTMLEKNGIHVTSKALYGMVFIHALSHAVLDCTNKIDKEGDLVRYDDKYQKIDPNFVSKEEEKQHVIFAQFMEESVATIMTLYYYSKIKPSPDQYGVLREWFPKQSLECMTGLEQFDMLNYSNDLIENYCAAWRGRKKDLKYIVVERK